MQDIQKVLSSISDAVWSFDLVDNKFIYFNNRLTELFEEPLNSSFKDSSFWLSFVHPEDYQYAATETDQAYQGKNIEVEYRIIVKGKVKWVLDKKAIAFNAEGKPQIITSFLTDITSKKTTETELTDLEKTFRYLFINNPNPLWIYDLKTLKFLEVNNAAIAKYGYSKEEFLSMTIADIRPAEDLPELFNHLNKVSNRFHGSTKYWRHLKKNGEVLYVNISGHGIKHKGRDAEIVMAHDITVEVESRQIISLAKENLDALINSLKEDIWSIDTNYCIISANNAYKQSLQESVGREVAIGDSVFLPEFEEEDKKQWKKYYDKALEGETFSFIELVNLPGKTPFGAEVKMSPIKNKKKIIGVACISNNIQEKLEARELIIKQNNKLHQLVSLASHEIRGPVATLLGLTDAFNTDDVYDPFNTEVIRMIHEISTKLDSVIHQIVDKSRSLRNENAFTGNVQHNRSKNG